MSILESASIGGAAATVQKKTPDSAKLGSPLSWSDGSLQTLCALTITVPAWCNFLIIHWYAQFNGGATPGTAELQLGIDLDGSLVYPAGINSARPAFIPDAARDKIVSGFYAIAAPPIVTVVVALEAITAVTTAPWVVNLAQLVVEYFP